jgi:uncharacterized protein YeaO (DUF488 family)
VAEHPVGVIGLARVHDGGDLGGRSGFLVDRLWPRGLPRAALGSGTWLPDVGPSHELRKWFGHEPQRWDEFRTRYFAELDRNPQTWQPLRDAVATGDVTLLYSARDTEHNNAVALREYLLSRLEEVGHR